MKPLLFLCLVALFGSLTEAQSQAKKFTVLGTILDADGNPVSNAIILIDGKATKVRSDKDGNFSIAVKSSAKNIGVVAPGAGFLEELIDGRDRIDFMYERVAAETPEETKEPDAMLETGYGKIKKTNAADAIGFLDVEHSTRKYSSLQQILMETPGLTFMNGMLVVAGSRTFQGLVPPLFVVDDIPSSGFPSLSPSQVSSVTVLKGSSAAIYGSRAYGGVVIIKTRIP
jgi:TonB-dependent SusC/RagA subfamily outer membrane receptor